MYQRLTAVGMCTCICNYNISNGAKTNADECTTRTVQQYLKLNTIV